jgi:hypothetical protein
VGRAAAAVSAAAAAIALIVTIGLAGHWETPAHLVSKAAKPLEGRIHFGRDPDTAAAAGRVRPPRDGATTPRAVRDGN